MLVAFSNWKGIGYGSIIYLAVITGIDPGLYETAHIDGASLLQRIRYVTLPFLTPTMVILVLLSLGNILKGGGEMFYQIIGNNTLLVGQADVIDSYILRSLINPIGNINFSMTAAVGIFQQVVGFVLIMTVNFTIRKFNPDYALF
jgi:putative aldouronate transport system permease protein